MTATATANVPKPKDHATSDTTRLMLGAIPVAASETRGLILIFSVQDPLTGKMLLRSTSDPEIKGPA